MSQLIFHPRTQAAMEQFKAEPSHSLLIMGNQGAGKTAAALSLVSDLVGPLSNHPYFLHLSPQNNTISIETIRELHQFVRLKTTGTQNWRRAIVIEDAHYMTREAQNALLKLLEEPPADTIIVLTATNAKSLLPTIASRAQKIIIKPLSIEVASNYFSQQNKDAAAIGRAFHMSGGQIGLMTRLLDEAQNQDLLHYVDAAKQLLQAKTFERLVLVDQFLKQKESVNDLLWALLAVCRAALHQAGLTNKEQLINRWRQSIEAVLRAQDDLPAHPLPKLLLTNLSLQL